MTLLHPWALAALLAVPVLVLLSLWRWRRREAPVSSLLLWRQVAGERTASPASHRRRKVDPLLLLRVAVALALAAGAAGFLVPHGERPGRRIAVLLDRSASMSISWPSCLEALDEALGALHASDLVDVVALPESGQAARRLAPAAARRLLETLEPTHQETLPADLARIAHLQPNDAAVLVVSDQPVEGLPDNASLLAAGASKPNRGIVGFAARRTEAGGFRVLATVAGDAAQAAVTLCVDGRDAGTQTVVVPAGGRAEAFFDAPADATVLTARLEGTDALEADNTAWLARSSGLARIALVGPSCPPLARALRTAGDSELAEMAEAPARAVPQGFDLAVYYRAVPQSLDGGTVVLVAPRQPVGRLRPTAPAAATGAPVGRRDPLLEAVDLSGVDLGPLPHPAGFESFEVLLRAGDAPVIGRWREGETRLLYVGADPALGNWPLHTSFPIFWANVLSGASGPGAEFTSGRPGEAVRAFRVPEGASVRGPGDSQMGLAGGTFRPERVGLYEVVADGKVRDSVAVSLLSEAETRTPAYEHPLPEGWIEPAQQRAAPRGTRDLTPWFLVAAALLVAAHERVLQRA